MFLSMIQIVAGRSCDWFGLKGNSWCLTVTIMSICYTSAALDFQREVRPILSDRCIVCHGPDEQKAGLRLDSGPFMKLGSRSGPILDSSNLMESEILRRIQSQDPEVMMPPPESRKRLSQADKHILQSWVVSGAEYIEHWAFQSPLRPPIPPVQNPSWCRNPLDAFVLNRMELAGVAPSPEADRWTLGRRLALDLTGLLPDPFALDAFVHDPSETAYQEYIEHLLNSPAYGERWARDWLDLARYADTNGYEKDRPRSIWPYRNWVIEAFNHNMPFDQFSTLQLAGDMLPEASLADRIATGFHRNTMTNEEGGIDVDEFRYHAIVDRVKTTGAAWLGLTLSCAQCHTHKYDPVTHKEYFSVFALFDNCDEPELPVPSSRQSAHHASLRLRMDELTQSRGAFSENILREPFEKWVLSEKASSISWQIAHPMRVDSELGATLTILEDQSVLAGGDKPNKDVYTIQWMPGEGTWTGLRLEMLPHASLPFDGPGRAHFFNDGDFFLSEVRLTQDKNGARELVAMGNASANRERDGRSIMNTLDGRRDTGWQAGNRTAVSSRARFEFSHPVSTGTADVLELVLDQHFIHQVTIGRFRIALTQADLPLPSARDFSHEVEESLYRLSHGQEISSAEWDLVRSAYLDQSPEVSEINQEIRQIKEELWNTTTTLVVQERPAHQRRQTFMRHRGEYLQPTEIVQPGVPASLLWRENQPTPQTRLEFAHWLFESGHPLTARVFVNRTWSRFFGDGIVATVEDFGLQGAMPTHPDLLDWMAVEFSENGWNMKEFHKFIVSSTTYRQSSDRRSGLDVLDPLNQLFHRGNRLRLPAEMIRDTALQASGLLISSMGGPGVFPPQDASVTRLAYGSPSYSTSQGADRYRRGIYTYWKRTAPYASFLTFDASSADAVCTRRDRSNTPLQSLALLNDPVYVEAAEALALELCRQCDSDWGQMIPHLFMRTLNRPPSADDQQVLLDFIDNLQSAVQSGNQAAVPVPASLAASLSPAQWTAAYSICRALLNTDAMITKP